MEHTINLFGNEENSQVVTLEPGEKRKVESVYQAIEPGVHLLCVGDSDLMFVVFWPSQLSFAFLRVHPGRL